MALQMNARHRQLLFHGGLLRAKIHLLISPGARCAFDLDHGALAFIAPLEGLRARAVGGSRLPPNLATMFRWARNGPDRVST